MEKYKVIWNLDQTYQEKLNKIGYSLNVVLNSVPMNENDPKNVKGGKNK